LIAVENTNLLDLIAGGLALAILGGGLVMLFLGVSAFGGKGK
jgi:Na+-transporting methylmalonyl-CoA/oxaloacetate decarboxylase gamma subunit